MIEEAADWQARLRSGVVSEVDRARFRAWLAGDPARRREFEELSALWDKLDCVAQSPEVLAEWRRIERACAADRVSRRAVVGWALAASLAGAAGVAGLVSWQRAAAFTTYSTAVGERRAVQLADGSVVTLNTSSRIRARMSGSERSIEFVEGQANFEVAKDPSRPFIVRVGQGEVRALGTLFDVYRRAEDVVVTLIEGRVAVVPEAAAGAGNDAIVLTAGQQLSYGAHGRAPLRTRANLRQVSAWRAGKLDFADTPLTEAIAEANRYSRLKIELRAPPLADAKISGIFEAGANEALAHSLRAYFDLHIERSDDLIVLTQQTR